jgi:CheY-like chemotaxis protein
MGKGEIWVFGDGPETSRHIAKVLSGLVNPVRVIENGFDFGRCFRDQRAPLLLLVDLANNQSWEALELAAKSEAAQRMAVIALVDSSTENLLDRAYDAGAKTYLRKPLVFADFVLRAKLLNLNFLVCRPGPVNDSGAAPFPAAGKDRDPPSNSEPLRRD